MFKRVGSLVVPLIAVVFLATGCGGDDASGPSTTLLVTRDFGAANVKDVTEVPATKGLTAMRQLQSQAELETTYGGRFVNSIDGLKGGGGNDWLFYVDGVDSDQAATEIRLAGGETVQWDFHPWQAVKLTGAIVGAFPEPLATRGARVICVDDASIGCRATKEALEDADVNIDGSGDGAAIVHVGVWSKLRGRDGVPDVSASPSESGVFASFDGAELGLADADGQIIREADPDAGLVFAYKDADEVGWVITGANEAGVRAAADALGRDSLRGRFAVIREGGVTTPLPVSDEQQEYR